MALASSRDGIQHYWLGGATRAPAFGRLPWAAFQRLAAFPRGAVLDQALGSLFTLDLTTPGTGRVKTRDGKVLAELVRPTGIAALAPQLAMVRTASDLRMDRLDEILVQQGDLLSFFGAMAFLHAERTKWTLDLLGAVLRVVTCLEMPLKLHFDVPRPVQFAEELQPVIQTPTHGAWPSGHATEAFALATVFSALTDPAWKGAEAAVAAATQPMRLAARIATNRTVAGVHFPTDSMAGAVMGLTIGEFLVRHLSGGGKVKARGFRGDVFAGDFSVITLNDELVQPAGGALGGGPVATGPASSPLSDLWTAAKAEWP